MGRPRRVASQLAVAAAALGGASGIVIPQEAAPGVEAPVARPVSEELPPREWCPVGPGLPGAVLAAPRQPQTPRRAQRLRRRVWRGADGRLGLVFSPYTLVIEEVLPSGAAAWAGLQVGERITELWDSGVASRDDISVALAADSPSEIPVVTAWEPPLEGTWSAGEVTFRVRAPVDGPPVIRMSGAAAGTASLWPAVRGRGCPGQGDGAAEPPPPPADGAAPAEWSWCGLKEVGQHSASWEVWLAWSGPTLHYCLRAPKNHQCVASGPAERDPTAQVPAVFETHKQLGAIELSDEDYEDALESIPFLLVTAYSPRCMACQMVDKIMADAFRKLAEQGSPAKWARFDAEQHRAASRRFEVHVLPRLRWFRNGGASDVTVSEWSADAVVRFVSTSTGPTVRVFTSKADFDELVEGHKGCLAVAGYVGEEENNPAGTAAFRSAADRTPSAVFATAPLSLLERLEVPLPPPEQQAEFLDLDTGSVVRLSLSTHSDTPGAVAVERREHSGELGWRGDVANLRLGTGRGCNLLGDVVSGESAGETFSAELPTGDRSFAAVFSTLRSLAREAGGSAALPVALPLRGSTEFYAGTVVVLRRHSAADNSADVYRGDPTDPQALAAWVARACRPVVIDHVPANGPSLDFPLGGAVAAVLFVRSLPGAVALRDGAGGGAPAAAADGAEQDAAALRAFAGAAASLRAARDAGPSGRHEPATHFAVVSILAPHLAGMPFWGPSVARRHGVSAEDLPCVSIRGPAGGGPRLLRWPWAPEADQQPAAETAAEDVVDGKFCVPRGGRSPGKGEGGSVRPPPVSTAAVDAVERVVQEALGGELQPAPRSAPIPPPVQHGGIGRLVGRNHDTAVSAREGALVVGYWPRGAGVWEMPLLLHAVRSARPGMAAASLDLAVNDGAPPPAESGPAPRHLYVTSPLKSDAHGLYELLDEEYNGMPVWGATASHSRLYSDTTGRWLFGPGEEMMMETGWVSSDEPHKGRLPHETPAWQHWNDQEWQADPWLSVLPADPRILAWPPPDGGASAPVECPIPQADRVATRRPSLGRWRARLSRRGGSCAAPRLRPSALSGLLRCTQGGAPVRGDPAAVPGA
eukprot:TRINITY_DN10312_c1_g1_i2.p1 TRINITY_DN10312_c1_g1~~TRINITY_DN10312_c1_g1_i2.p1  ORF type:complete len:1118 (+),score=241.79 TRINITY_DN10312_c1_g1_i2:75-3356(+)